MMQRISKVRDQVYTNHSVRATVVHRLCCWHSRKTHCVCDRSQECTESPELCQSDRQPARPKLMASVLDGTAAIATSRNTDIQLDEADMDAAALAVADLDSFPLEPAFSAQKSAVSVSSISDDASKPLNLAHGALQHNNFNGSVGTCHITINVVPDKGLLI